MGLLSWLILGAIAGGLANRITGGNRQMGCLTNIIVGVIGATIGGFIGTRILSYGTVDEFSLGSIAIATFGAVIFLSILNAVQKKK